MSQLKQVLSTMTTREKLDHIWTYYKLHICAILLAVILVISWGVSIYINSKEVLLSGNIINVFLSEEGQHYLTEDSFAAMGGSHDRQTVKINSQYISPEDPSSYLQSMPERHSFCPTVHGRGQNLLFGFCIKHPPASCLPSILGAYFKLRYIKNRWKTSGFLFIQNTSRRNPPAHGRQGFGWCRDSRTKSAVARSCHRT